MSLPPPVENSVVGDDAIATMHLREGESSAAFPPPGTRIDRYVVLSAIGAGGMGRVVSALDTTLGRTVALKLLSADSSQAREDLLREAQAMARVRHPNVVPVYDAGEHAGRVFLAMEYVRGPTLRAWMRQEKLTGRRAREGLRLLLGAGRGLAAAHEAGVVHLDFKPENVLVDEATGEARVTDFGLAAARPGVMPETSSSSSGDCVVVDLLRTSGATKGFVVGTPPYMAPEQLRAEGTDERTDQFAFCVVLHEVMGGRRPFLAESLNDLRRAIEKVRFTKPEQRLPRWIEPILRQGLKADPAARYPTMAALLEALARDPTPLRWGLAAGALAVVVGAGVAFTAQTRAQAAERDCVKDADAILVAWRPELAATGRAAFARSQVTGWQNLWERTQKNLDTYAQGWRNLRLEACRAHEASTSPRLARLRTACLSRRKTELAELGRLVADADAELVGKSVSASTALAPLESCARADELLASPEPPNETLRDAVNEARQGLAEARALGNAGKFQADLARSAQVVAAARLLGYGPLLAEALVDHGRARFRVEGSAQESVAELEESYRVALASRAFIAAGAAASHLTSLVGHVLGHYAEGHAWARLGEAALGPDESVEANDTRVETLRSEAYIFYEEELGDRAVEVAQRAFDIAARQNTEDLEPMHLALGIAHSAAGHLDVARAHMELALEMSRAKFGPDHLSVSDRISDLATVAMSAGNGPESVALLDEALAGYVRAHALERLSAGYILLNRSYARLMAGDCAGAVTDAKASEDGLVRRLGSDSSDLISLDFVRGECARRGHRFAEAHLVLEKAEAIAKARDTSSRLVDEVRFASARLIWEETPARRPAARALAIRARDDLAPRARSPLERTVLADMSAWIKAHGEP